MYIQRSFFTVKAPFGQNVFKMHVYWVTDIFQLLSTRRYYKNLNLNTQGAGVDSTLPNGIHEFLQIRLITIH